MCGRLAIHNLDAVFNVAEQLGIPNQLDLACVQARYNTQPTHFLPVIWGADESPVLGAMQWGWRKARGGRSARHINAKSETVFQLPTFRQAARHGRCVIIANGYYEWRRDFQDRPLEPHFIQPRHHSWLAIAGIYQLASDTHQQECALLTMAPNPVLATIHHRMPCMLDLDGISAWLTADSPERASEVLRPVADDFVVEYPVSARVNKVGNEGADLIVPVPPPPSQVDWI